jgi:hypothetical protein
VWPRARSPTHRRAPAHGNHCFAHFHGCVNVHTHLDDDPADSYSDVNGVAAGEHTDGHGNREAIASDGDPDTRAGRWLRLSGGEWR